VNCPTKTREKCRAFTRNLGQKCWLAIIDPTVGGKTNKDYTGCKRCPWYKKLNSLFLTKQTYITLIYLGFSFFLISII